MDTVIILRWPDVQLGCAVPSLVFSDFSFALLQILGINWNIFNTVYIILFQICIKSGRVLFKYSNTAYFSHSVVKKMTTLELNVLLISSLWDKVISCQVIGRNWGRAIWYIKYICISPLTNPDHNSPYITKSTTPCKNTFNILIIYTYQ